MKVRTYHFVGLSVATCVGGSGQAVVDEVEHHFTSEVKSPTLAGEIETAKLNLEADRLASMGGFANQITVKVEAVMTRADYDRFIGHFEQYEAEMFAQQFEEEEHQLAINTDEIPF